MIIEEIKRAAAAAPGGPFANYQMNARAEIIVRGPDGQIKHQQEVPATFTLNGKDVIEPEQVAEIA
jgi:hypothetical protein